MQSLNSAVCFDPKSLDIDLRRVLSQKYKDEKQAKFKRYGDFNLNQTASQLYGRDRTIKCLRQITKRKPRRSLHPSAAVPMNGIRNSIFSIKVCEQVRRWCLFHDALLHLRVENQIFNLVNFCVMSACVFALLSYFICSRLIVWTDRFGNVNTVYNEPEGVAKYLLEKKAHVDIGHSSAFRLSAKVPHAKIWFIWPL
ncbi:hypothetical protein ROZALSC1DRAFT_23262 [Rozella allomycis CSF55]|uniref:Uncharacterized protein n=1 Tax=Rozella allomycis (strain CSF55) TaxID=988480 RepID=A0A4P9YG01_ROZAC|nr:hypothetical protein ROZALSC1DRAFT_23262 [Rozella allomycis CSF55]